MMLSGCSNGQLTPVSKYKIPEVFIIPTPTPRFEVKNWGDYPEYVEQIVAALAICNTDKAAIKSLSELWNTENQDE
ncbi:hypothetical protein FX356_20100 [Salmonella enterica]|nr:hypothetical protein [Salmonella enterica]ECO9619378.1 hypothetical protein [Salmonella enterica]EDW9607635.1 hypothetical protein [Salmonella enterica subsp. houtenae serovar 50:z4,z23:-]